jgi:hypothetical protein
MEIEMEMENYIKVSQFCDEIGCQLLTSFEEFEAQRQNVLNQCYHYVRVDFIGLCGHASSAVVTNFMTRKTGVNCKECVKKKTATALKNKPLESSELEYMSLQIFEDLIKDKYEIVRTNEGCRADLAIRKRNGDLYMGIQLKTTMKQIHKMYSFRCLDKDYKNMLIVAICISEKKVWIVPYNETNLKTTLNISSRSKYNKYFVEDNNLITEYLDKYLEIYCISSLEELNTPVSKYQKREQEYVQKREKYVNFLEYSRPNAQNTPTDFMVNGKKIQEKVCGNILIKKNYRLIAHLSSNNGKNEKGMRQYRTYYLGENDYYWFHSSIDDRFWIIPEKILYEKRLISESNVKKGKQIINLTSNCYDVYKYDYMSFDKEKIMDLFK